MFAQNVLSSYLYRHTTVEIFDFAARPPVYAGFGRVGHTKRMKPTIAPARKLPARWRLVRCAVGRTSAQQIHRSMIGTR